MLRLKLIDSLQELACCRSDWNRAAGDNPFLRAEWMHSWMNHMSSNHRPAVLVDELKDGGRAFAPFCIERSRGGGKTLKFMSCGTACADYLDLIAPAEEYDAFADKVVSWLRANSDTQMDNWSGFDSIELDGLAKFGRTHTVFVDKLNRAGFRSHCSEIEGCWAVRLPNCWASLNEQFSKKHRRKTKKAVQRLGSDEVLLRKTPEHSVDELWPTFVRLHQLRRKAVGQPGCFSDPSFEKFLYQAVCELVQADQAQLLQLCFHRQPFAAALLLYNQEQTLMYQTGMNPACANLEPGYQLIVASMQDAIEHCRCSFDFLRGDEPYKARWNTKRIPLVRVRLAPPKFGPAIRHQLWVSGRKLKDYALQMGLLHR